MSPSPPRASILDEIDLRLFIPLVANTVLLHVAVLLTRLGATYRGLELELSVVVIGVIAASFSLLPAVLAVPVGRFIDRGHDALAIRIGSVLSLVSAVGFVIVPSNAVTLALNTAVMGVGQLACMAGHQIVCVRAAKGPRGREAIFGYHMVAIAFGQGVGPFIVSWLAGNAAIPPTGLVFQISILVGSLAALTAFGMQRAAAGVDGKRGEAAMGLGELVRVKGLIAYIVASLITITGLDIIVIYLPLLGAERGIDAGVIGAMLAARAAASMVSRLVYVPLLDVLGRMPLTYLTMLSPALAFLVVAAPAPVWLMYVAVIVAGMGLGVSATLTLSGVVDVAPPRARATALSLRLSGNRVGLVLFPFLASLVATAGGIGGVFIVVAALLAGATGGVWKAKQGAV